MLFFHMIFASFLFLFGAPEITAAPVQLPQVEVTVETSAAPVIVEEVVVPEIIVAEPVMEEVPVTVPMCLEDQPCWDCATMGNKICGPVTVVDAYSDNPIVNCEAQGLITAEDYSCVNPNFFK